ncbi:hypothetical protein SAMN05892883_1907 [Jatrophihabitans sp. GAS493]|uniref:hypothetical protein n=1 Tax=Jatrophihabitans sp. GAS493 TaxID=1907575 RepID=UPI000BB7D381|nr:hypothetical protein [Jatrophihabitans sp. GAS493]SOD72515.1 hypothetical protein SAMN05892883_1907 [Jatrophihabitans sp. GAS493]
MRRGLLKNYTDTLCDIFVGWRLHASGDDMPMMMSVGVGNLEMDLLDGSTTLDREPVTFQFGQELSGWLRERADADGLGWSNISRAFMRVRFDFDETSALGRRRWWQIRARVQDSRRVLIFDCEASIESTAGSASSVKKSREVGVRSADGPWIVR